MFRTGASASAGALDGGFASGATSELKLNPRVHHRVY